MSAKPVDTRRIVKWAAWGVVVALVAYLAYVNVYWSEVYEPK
jgi:hypothetical protein